MLDDPATMTPSQRRHEIATLLARGVLRLRQNHKKEPISRSCRTVKKVSESSRDCLEVRA